MPETEVQPLQSNPRGDDEIPAFYGSNWDKLCLVPFFVFCAALGYYGVKGASEFNLYEQGEAQASAFCMPLNEAEGQCRSDLKVKATEAASAAKSQAVQGLQKGTDAFTGLLGTVSGACLQLKDGVGKCKELESSISRNSLFALPQLPELPVSAAATDASEAAKEAAGDLELKTKTFISSFAGTCENAAAQLGSLCSNVTEAMTSAGQKVDKAVASLADDAVKKVEEAFVEALNKSSGALCPPIGNLTKACTSLSDAVADSLAAAEANAEKLLPKEIPLDLIEDFLAKAENAALDYVQGICQNGANITKDCPSYFAADRWRALLDPIRQPLLALQGQLHNVTDIMAQSVAGQCNKLSSGITGACATAKSTAAGIVDKAKEKAQFGTDYTAAAVTQFQNGLSDELSSMRGVAVSQFGAAQNFLQTLVGGCSEVSDIAQSHCDALGGIEAGTLDAMEDLAGSLQQVGDGGAQIDVGCDKVGDLHETCKAVANPRAALMKGATSLIQHKTAEIVLLEGYLLIGCFVSVVMVLGIIKWCTKLVVTIAIVLNLLSLASMAVGNLMIMNLPMAAMFGCIFLLKLCWLWCIRGKFDFAVTLIHCGVQAVESLLGISAWILGLVLIVLEVGVIILAAGANYLLTGPNPPPEIQQVIVAAPGLIPVLLVFSYVWAMEVLSNIIHVTICCALGSAIGVKTPAKSACGAFCFALTGGLGSIVLGSFWIALLKALQDALERGKSSENPCVQIIIRAVCCAIEWILNFFNAYAFVFVGLKGSSYFDASRRTIEVFSRDGVAAVAADEALHDVVKIAKQVVLWVTIALSLVFGFQLNIIGVTQRSWYEVITGPVLCWAMAAATTYALTLPMGRLLEAAVCTLFIIFDDFRSCMKDTQPQMYQQLQDACDQKNNQGLLG